MIQKTQIKFKVKDSKEAESPLLTEFKINGTRFKFYPSITVKTALWSYSKEKVLSSHSDYKKINEYLDTYRDELFNIISGFEAKQVKLDKNLIQSELKKALYGSYTDNTVEVKEGEVNDFISFIDEYIKDKEKLKLAKTTISILKQNRRFIITAFDLVNKKELAIYSKLAPKVKARTDLKPSKLLDFASINLDFLKKFQQFMYNETFTVKVLRKEVEKNYKQNYIAKQIKILKQFIDAGIEEGKITNFKYGSIKAKTEDVDTVYTDLNELQLFLNLKLEGNERLTRDKYVFNSFLGLRYSDLKKIKENFFKVQSIHNEKQLVYTGRNQKTDLKLAYVVHPTAVKIIKAYDFEFPDLSEKTYNETLKKIALQAGLTELVHIRETRGGEKISRDVPKYLLISSHTGRRTFCTNMYVAGVPIQAIMKVSGHKSEKEFLKYINKDAIIDISLVSQQVNAIKPLKVLN